MKTNTRSKSAKSITKLKKEVNIEGGALVANSPQRGSASAAKIRGQRTPSASKRPINIITPMKAKREKAATACKSNLRESQEKQRSPSANPQIKSRQSSAMQHKSKIIAKLQQLSMQHREAQKEGALKGLKCCDYAQTGDQYM